MPAIWLCASARKRFTRIDREQRPVELERVDAFQSFIYPARFHALHRS